MSISKTKAILMRRFEAAADRAASYDDERGPLDPDKKLGKEIKETREEVQDAMVYLALLDDSLDELGKKAERLRHEVQKLESQEAGLKWYIKQLELVAHDRKHGI